jgi:putative membrane protein
MRFYVLIIHMIKLVARILITALAVLAIANIIPGIAVSGFGIAVVVAIVWGILGLTVRPLLNLLALPINLLTFGLFSFIINALVFWLMAGLVPGFSVDGFIPALEGSLILAVVAWVLHAIF